MVRTRESYAAYATSEEMNRLVVAIAKHVLRSPPALLVPASSICVLATPYLVISGIFIDASSYVFDALEGTMVPLTDHVALGRLLEDAPHVMEKVRRIAADLSQGNEVPIDISDDPSCGVRVG